MNVLQDAELTRPIPLHTEEKTIAWDSANVKFNFDEPKSRDPLVVVRDHGVAIDGNYSRSDGLNFPYCRALTDAPEVLLRTSVVDKIILMRDRLHHFGLEPVVLDGYRDMDIQRALWAHMFKQVQAKNGGKSEVELRRIASKYCWDPERWDSSDAATWPVHMTGGAVDMTLRRIESGEQLFMGSVFDDPESISHADYFELRCLELGGRDALSISEVTALYNRRILLNAARSAGLTHYWAEWWHYDYGTQIYARACAVEGRASEAFYEAILALK